jgi:hypothetical protein
VVKKNYNTKFDKESHEAHKKNSAPRENNLSVRCGKKNLAELQRRKAK